MAEKVVNVLIEGGKATPAPPLGPSLAMYKVNIGKIIKDLNEKTKEYEGMKVPVKIIIDDETKEYRFELGTPPVSSLIRKELGLKRIAPEKKEEETTEVEEEGEEKVEKRGRKEAEVKKEEKIEEKGEIKEGEKEAEEEPKERVIVGDLTIDQCIKIARMKRESLLAKNVKKAVKEIVASCVSMPITVENKNPKEVLKEIDEGKYDDKIPSSG